MLSRLPECPLRASRGKQNGHDDLFCLAGVNFYGVCDVSPGHVICQHCPLPRLDLDVALDCEHLEVYTFLGYDEERQPVVDIEAACLLPNAARNYDRCNACPLRRGMRERASWFSSSILAQCMRRVRSYQGAVKTAFASLKVLRRGAK